VQLGVLLVLLVVEHLLVLLLLHKWRVLLHRHGTVFAVVTYIWESSSTHHCKLARTMLLGVRVPVFRVLLLLLVPLESMLLVGELCRLLVIEFLKEGTARAITVVERQDIMISGRGPVLSIRGDSMFVVVEYSADRLVDVMLWMGGSEVHVGWGRRAGGRGVRVGSVTVKGE